MQSLSVLLIRTAALMVVVLLWTVDRWGLHPRHSLAVADCLTDPKPNPVLEPPLHLLGWIQMNISILLG